MHRSPGDSLDSETRGKLLLRRGCARTAGEFQGAADILLFDAKPPPGAGKPGGNGVAFDWTLLKAYEGETPFLIAGGLTPDTVAAPVKAQKARAAFLGVDVSSGVETAPGRKDAKLVKAFIAAAKK